jgi:hypothetical protein
MLSPKDKLYQYQLLFYSPNYSHTLYYQRYL